MQRVALDAAVVIEDWDISDARLMWALLQLR